MTTKTKKPATEVAERLPLQGIGEGTNHQDLSGLFNVMRCLLRLVRDRTTCTVVLKMHDGEFTGYVGFGRLRMRLGQFGLEKHRNQTDEKVIERFVEGVVKNGKK